MFEMMPKSAHDCIEYSLKLSIALKMVYYCCFSFYVLDKNREWLD